VPATASREGCVGRMMTSRFRQGPRPLLLLLLAGIAGLALPRQAEALFLLCTNRPTVTQDAVETVAKSLSLDGSSIIVFSDDLAIPAEKFDRAFIVEVLDRPGIATRCGEFLGVAPDRLASIADSLRSRIGTMFVPVPGLPGGPLLSVGELFEAGDRPIFLQVTHEGGALEALMAIMSALDADLGKCSVDPQCYGLVDRL
jgi:hypothetical protein